MRRVLLALTLVLLALPAAAMTLDGYIAALEQIESLVRARQYTVARSAALALRGQTIPSPGGDFHADETIVRALEHPERVDPRLATRIAATVAELRVGQGDASAAQPNLKLIDEIEKQQHVAQRKDDGEVALDASDSMLRYSASMKKAWDWVVQKIGDFIDWLAGFWPESARAKDEKPRSIRGIVIGIAIMIAAVVTLLAWTTLRRSRRDAPELLTSAAPIASARDEDPLSRESNEWEGYAAQLGGAGRHREAIRAWYHAVLVTLYGASILHYRKGRTNWEYVAALSPSLTWRRRFIDLTRRFEHEWYGAIESTEDALDDCRSDARAILGAITRRSRGAA